MHFSAVTSLAIFALGANAAIIPTPKGFSAFFSTFNHLNCDIASQGRTLVEDANAGACQNMDLPAISLTLDQLKEGCSVTVYPYSECRGRPQKIEEAGCFNSDTILQAYQVDCA